MTDLTVPCVFRKYRRPASDCEADCAGLTTALFLCSTSCRTFPFYHYIAGKYNRQCIGLISHIVKKADSYLSADLWFL